MLSKNLTEIGKEGNPAYECWLNYRPVEAPIAEAYKALCRFVHVSGSSPVLNSAASELALGLESILGILPEKGQGYDGITLTTAEKTDLLTPSEKDQILPEGFMIRHHPQGFVIAGKDDRGILYGVFAFLRLLQLKTAPEAMNRVENPANMLRMVNHWDNIDGSVERGYAGKSIYFRNNQFIMDVKRLRDYARLLASVGINAVVINNVNVHYHETLLIDRYLPDVVKVAEIFRLYGVTLYLSINYSSPIQLGGLDNADPLDPTVQAWWCEKARQIYQRSRFGGFWSSPIRKTAGSRFYIRKGKP